MLLENPYSWHTNFSMLYIDNPAGVGFSFTDDTGYSANVSQVTDELYLAMSQFFQLFPMLRAADFYISGQSYAGKYVPALGNRIHEQNKVQLPKIKLKVTNPQNRYVEIMNFNMLQGIDDGQCSFGHLLSDECCGHCASNGLDRLSCL